MELNNINSKQSPTIGSPQMRVSGKQQSDDLEINKPIKSKNFSSLIMFGVSLLVVGAVMYYVGFSKGQLAKQNDDKNKLNINIEESVLKKEVSPTLISELDDNWQTYKSNILGVSFKLPPELSSKGEFKEDVIPGEKGTVYCSTFQKNQAGAEEQKYRVAGCSVFSFGLSSTSYDFQEGRGGAFVDFQGYELKDGVYYGKFPDDKKFEIPSDVVKEFKSSGGVEMVIVRGKHYEEETTPFLSEGRIGALVNTTNSSYPGFVVLLDLNEGFTEEDFNQILSTFEYQD